MPRQALLTLVGVAQFERDGYVVVKNAVLPEEIPALRAELETLYARGVAGENVPGINLTGTNYKAIIEDVFVNYPQYFKTTFCNERVVHVLRELLGKDFVLMPDSSGHWEYFNDWHTDVTSPEQRGVMNHLQSGWRHVTVGLYLQDNNEFGGGISVVPGSHHERDPYVEVRRQISKVKHSPLKRAIRALSLNNFYYPEKQLKHHPHGVDLKTQAGDAIVFDMRLIHRSTYAKTKNKPPYNGKLAFFSRAARNDAHVQPYIDFMGYEYLKKPRDISAIQTMADEFGFICR